MKFGLVQGEVGVGVVKKNQSADELERQGDEEMGLPYPPLPPLLHSYTGW